MPTKCIGSVKETVIVGLVNLWQSVDKSLCLTTPNNPAAQITNVTATTKQILTNYIIPGKIQLTHS